MDGGSGGGGESQWASWDSSAFCWSVCDDSPPPQKKNTPISILIRLSICLPSTVVPLPASLSPVDPPSCFLLTRHHVLILAAPFRTADLSTIAFSNTPSLRSGHFSVLPVLSDR